MKKSINNLLLLVSLFGLFETIFADVPPPVFPGYSLIPFDSRDIRIKSEKIDIYYGDTCKIIAVLEILNPTRAMVKKKIGIPLHTSIIRKRTYNSMQKSIGSDYRIYDFIMNLNGVNLRETDIPNGNSMCSDREYWYGWTCELKPNMNIVKLTYHVLSSPTGKGVWERTLQYIFNYDKDWPNIIENVQVTVHFPQKIARKQVLAETSPPGYEITDKNVIWRFSSFKPKIENNIVLHVVDFKVFADMLKYEKVLSVPDTDNVTKLKAAKFFAGIAPRRGMNFPVPTRLVKSYCDEFILSKLSPAERDLFDSVYKLINHFNVEYYCVNDFNYYEKNPSLLYPLMDIMDRFGYFEKTVHGYIEGAKRLFLEIVTSDPNNTEAWKTYIDNYYLIYKDGCHPCVRFKIECNCLESQKELIKKAFSYCGKDSTIALWNRFMFPTQAPLPAKLEVTHYIESQERVTIKIEYLNHSWSDRPLSSEEFGILKKAYTMSKDGYFVLSNANLDRDTEKMLVEILGGCNLYSDQFCRDLAKIKAQKK